MNIVNQSFVDFLDSLISQRNKHINSITPLVGMIGDKTMEHIAILNAEIDFIEMIKHQYLYLSGEIPTGTKPEIIVNDDIIGSELLKNISQKQEGKKES